MAKKISKKEKVGMLADKLNEAIESCNFEPTEELDLFAEAVALLIAYIPMVNVRKVTLSSLQECCIPG